MPREGDHRELKSEYDPSDRRARLILVREMTSMANAGGGEIRLGEAEDGTKSGLDEATVTALDAARVQDLIDEFVKPDHVGLEVAVEPADTTARSVVVITIAAARVYPVVFTKSGDYDDNGQSKQVFAKHAVYRRRGTRAEPARREDFRRWIDEAIERERESWKSRVAVLARLPEGASLEVVTDNDEALDEPAALLRHQTRLFNRNPEKLLTKHDLAMIFLARSELVLRDDESMLLLHSAMRRRPTLFFWLDLIHPDPVTVRQMIDDTLAGSDRDKSDAARSIVEIAALFLDDDGYREVVTQLTASDYAHFREQAEQAPDRDTAIERILGDRDTNLDGTPIREWSDTDLESLADELARPMITTGGYDGPSRKLARVSIELFLRRRRGDLLSTRS